jgi:hypothetical protein
MRMYTELGCDVLFLQLRVPQHVLPVLTRPAIVELLDVICFLLAASSSSSSANGAEAAEGAHGLATKDDMPRPLIFHVFSGGCYMFGELLRMLTEEGPSGPPPLSASRAGEAGAEVQGGGVQTASASAGRGRGR